MRVKLYMNRNKYYLKKECCIPAIIVYDLGKDFYIRKKIDVQAIPGIKPLLSSYLEKK